MTVQHAVLNMVICQLLMKYGIQSGESSPQRHTRICNRYFNITFPFILRSGLRFLWLISCDLSLIPFMARSLRRSSFFFC